MPGGLDDRGDSRRLWGLDLLALVVDDGGERHELDLERHHHDDEHHLIAHYTELQDQLDVDGQHEHRKH